MMNNKGKAVVFLVILIVLSLGIGATAYFLYQQKSAEFRQLSLQYEEVTGELKTKTMELETVTALKTSLEAKLADTQSQLSEASKKIKSLTSDLDKETKTKKQSQEEIAKLKASLEAEQKLKAAMEKDLSDSTQALSSMEQRIKEMEEKLKALESEKKSLEEKVRVFEGKGQNVELGTISVVNEPAAGAETRSASPVKTAGKIAVVNKEYSFAVINLGSRDGVSVGNVFTVFHADKEVGDIKVEKVHETMAAAGFLAPDLKDKISEGDKVEFKK